MPFKDEVEEFIEGCLESRPLLEPHFGDFSLECISGNSWHPDITIVDSSARGSEALGRGVKLIGEIKIQQYSEGNRPKLNTYLEHMWRAGARFCDVGNWQIPKYLLFPYLIERPKGFDFNAYFKSMDVLLLDWSKTEHVEILKDQIAEL